MNFDQKIANIVFDHLAKDPKVHKLEKLGLDGLDIEGLEMIYRQAWEEVGVTPKHTPTNFGGVGISLEDDYRRNEAKERFLALLNS